MRILLIILLLSPFLPAEAQVVPLVPRDDGATDPSFITFRAGLVEIVARRDADAILALIAPEATLSFGGTENGPAGFREVWFDGSTLRDAFWIEFGRILALGSIRSDNDISQSYDNGETMISAPYVFDAWPQTLDAFTHGAIVGENVRVRAAPSLSAAILTALTYTTVEVLNWNASPDPESRDWTLIKLADGRSGYVATRFMQSPIGYRVGFLKRSGSWSIVFFVAGD